MPGKLNMPITGLSTSRSVLMFTTAGPAFLARGTKLGSAGAAVAEVARNMKPVTARAVFLRIPFMGTPCEFVFRAKEGLLNLFIAQEPFMPL